MPIAQDARRANRIIRLPPALDHHLRFPERVEEFSVEQFVPQLPIEALDVAVLPRASWLDVQRLHRHPAEPYCRTALAVNSGPLSDWMSSDTPRWTKSAASRWSTSSARSWRATFIATHSRVYSSTIVSSRIGRPRAGGRHCRKHHTAWHTDTRSDRALCALS